MVVVPAPPVILRQTIPFHLATTLAPNTLDSVALVTLACPALLPVVGHNILGVGPAPEVGFILIKKYSNMIAEDITFTSLCSAAVDTLQTVPEIQYWTDVHNPWQR